MLRIFLCFVGSLLLSAKITWAQSNLSSKLSELFCPSNMTCEWQRMQGERVELCQRFYRPTNLQKDIRRRYQCLNESSEHILDILNRRHNQCVELEYLGGGSFAVYPLRGQHKLNLYVQDCSEQATRGIYINCQTSSYFVNKRVSRFRANPDKSKILLTPFMAIPHSCSQWPRTSARGREYQLEAFSLPTKRPVRISQCYLGPFSHQNRYALDMAIAEDEPIHSLKAGVAVTVNDGSPYHCWSTRRNGRHYFKIFKNKIHVDPQLNVCPSNDCGTFQFPHVCRRHTGVNQVIVQHADGTLAQFMHLKGDNQDVEFGDVVEVGAKLGKIGLNGWVTGAHLHMSVFQMLEVSGRLDYLSIPVAFKANGGVHYACTGRNHGITMRP